MYKREQMKKIFDKEKMKQQWRNLLNSTRNKISRGAANINKIISWARNENWRRKDRHDKKNKKD
jgi:hypothetical protein